MEQYQKEISNNAKKKEDANGTHSNFNLKFGRP